MTGTGVGTRGYSIIEQGQVGRIVSSKPEERRYIIDEAAGITRFKAELVVAGIGEGSLVAQTEVTQGPGRGTPREARSRATPGLCVDRPRRARRVRPGNPGR